ncbi:MAG: SET domain-containing protein-lysine N-methyltransferase, partial [Candidatus Omnitrophica bacterium]|nr:SET domain-containing protein-lysine N-methyltransferase [Candidatus Omnitrophota bacterium]
FIAPCDETRYLNHSCNANILGADPGFDIVVRDIKKGEELTYDYRDFYDDIKMQCHCGEKKLL